MLTLSRLCRIGRLTLLPGLLVACGASPQVNHLLSSPPTDLYVSAALDRVPFYPQEAYQCGPAALATVLNYSGATVSVDELVNQVYIPARRGSLQPEMLAAARGHGRIPYQINPALEALLAEVQAGRPVLVFQNLGLDWMPQWHYAVVVGYDLDARQLTLRSGTVRDYTISLALFDRTWERTGRWAFVTLRPGELPAVPEESRFLEALVTMAEVADARLVIPGYRAAVDRWPQSALFPFALGNLFYRKGSLAMARQQFERLVFYHPDFADGHNNLAQVLFEQGQLAAAAHHARQAVNLGGSRVSVYQDTLADILAEATSPAR